jgi:hypothetical protein
MCRCGCQGCQGGGDNSAADGSGLVRTAACFVPQNHVFWPHCHPSCPSRSWVAIGQAQRSGGSLFLMPLSSNPASIKQQAPLVMGPGLYVGMSLLCSVHGGHGAPLRTEVPSKAGAVMANFGELCLVTPKKASKHAGILLWGMPCSE